MKQVQLYFFLSTALFLLSCQRKINSSIMSDNEKVQQVIDIQGHRGCRGLLPENTIPAFMKAMELGVTTLEMDLVISKDHKVIVSHEPFFNHEISSHPDGFEITKDNETNFNIYSYDYSTIRKFDVGSKVHPRFKKQEKLRTYKPLLSELITAVKHKAEELSVAIPYFNVEIKRNPKYDHVFHPDAKVFAQLVLEQINQSGIKDKFYIQSFDLESLETVKTFDPDLPLVYLVNKKTGKKNLKKLSFTPTVYSPNYRLVNKKLVQLCKAKNILLIPWTVNKKNKMKKMISLGVDGIITDYPDKLIKLVSKDKRLKIK